MLVLEPQGTQVCQWRETFDLLYLLAEIQTTYFMEVEEDGWMSINLLCRDWLISFMRTTSAVLPGWHFDLDCSFKTPIYHKAFEMPSLQQTLLQPSVTSLFDNVAMF